MPTTQANVTIRGFRAGDEAGFRRLNEQWIKHYFVMEAKDEATFADPWNTIIRRGGKILFALRNEELIGCCALIPIAPREFEVAKMAVSPTERGQGVGRQLLESVIAEARKAGATRLYLETNHQMKPAIHLYEALGFRHLPAERVVPSPYARADVYMEMNL